MWVSKKKLKEIEDKYAEKLDQYQASIDSWCEIQNERNLKRSEKIEKLNAEHHALVEKFLKTMVKALAK